MKHSFFLALFALTHCLSLRAQTGYSLKQYTAENGLPQNSVKGIAADMAGYIWLATEDGLTRFDGHHFDVFNSTNLGIKSNRVASIRQSVRKASNSASYLSGNERGQVFYAKFIPELACRIENGKVTVDSLYYRNRAYRLRSPEFGIRELNDVTFIVGVPDLLYSYPTGHDQHMIMDGGGKGSFFLVDKSRIRYYSDWKKQYERQSPGPLLWNYFSIGKRLYYRHGNGYYSEISENVPSTFLLEGDPCKANDCKKGKQKFYWNGNSEQAFLFYDNNLYIFEQDTNGKLSAKILVKNFDLSARGIDVIFYDTVSDRIFLGSGVNGLFVLSRNQFQALTVKGQSATNIFHAQLPYTSNTVLTPTGLILGLDSFSNQSIVRHLPALAHAHPAEKRVIARGMDSTIWIRDWWTLLRLDHKKLRVSKEAEFESEIEGICTPTPDQLWVGTEKTGIFKLDLSTDARKPVRVIGPKIGKVTCIEAKNRFHILVGTENGLFVIDALTGKTRLILATKGIHIESIRPFGNKQAWITGQGKGLMLLDDHNRLTAFPLDKKQYLANPHCVVDDENGYLWITTNKGLFQVRKEDLFQYAQMPKGSLQQKQYEMGYNDGLFYLYHSMEEGFATNEFNGSCQPCGVRLPNGSISLPSLKGLVWFDPHKIRPYLPNGDIILDKVEVDRKTLKTDGKIITIPNDTENVKISLSTAYFGHGNNLDLSYAIVKQDESISALQWVPLEDRKLEIQISALRSGEYSLYIKKLNGFGLKNYYIKSFSLLFPEKWYENRWLIMSLLFLMFAGVAFGTHSYNRHKLRTMLVKNIQLEETVATRTEKLRQTLVGLEASKKDMDKQVYLLSRLVASISHDIRSPLSYIGFASQSITKLIETNELQEASKVGKMISDVTEQMSTTLEQALDFIKVQILGSKPRLEYVDIHRLIQEKSILFVGKMRINNNSFENQIMVGQTIQADYQLFSIIIHNLLDNATKHTLKGKIWTTFQLVDGTIPEIVIANSGGNIPSEVVNIINSRATDKSFSDFIKDGKIKGIGLLIVKEIALIANISVTVSQTTNTYFHLRFPQTSQIDDQSTGS